MTRYNAAGTAADYTILAGDTVTVGASTGQNAVIVGGIAVTWWNARSGGTQYSDLLDENSVAITQALSSDGTDGWAFGQIPRVQYPDGVLGAWASAGGGPRVWMPADVGPLAAATATQSQDTADDFAAFAADPPSALMPVWSQDTATVGTGTYRIYNPTGGPLTMRGVVASVGGNTPSGASIVVQLKVDGVAAFVDANRPTIAAGGRTSGVASTLAVTAWPAGSYLTVDVVQVGSTTAGSKLTVQALAY